MARYEITKACGHEVWERFDMPTKQRDWYIERAEGRDCSDCWQAARDEARRAESEAAASRATELGLAKLEGSERQVAWAETLRDELIARLDRTEAQIPALVGRCQGATSAELRRRIRESTSARWYIENKHHFASGIDPDGGPPVTVCAVFDQARLKTSKVDGQVGIALTKTEDWHGCTAFVWDRSVTLLDDGTAELALGDNETSRVTDGRLWGYMRNEDLLEALNRPLDGPGERRYLERRWDTDRSWQRFDIPASDVEEYDGGMRVWMRKSKWEGLFFKVPSSWVSDSYRVGMLTVALKSDRTVYLLGGQSAVPVDAQQVFDDRVNPLTEPGESQFVAEPELWTTLRVHERHVSTTKSGKAIRVRFSGDSGLHGACFYHPTRFARRTRDERTWVLRAPKTWTWTVVDVGGDRTEYEWLDFQDLVTGWAEDGPGCERGMTKVTPVTLAPVEVDVPEDLLDTWDDVDDDDQEDESDVPDADDSEGAA